MRTEWFDTDGDTGRVWVNGSRVCMTLESIDRASNYWTPDGARFVADGIYRAAHYIDGKGSTVAELMAQLEQARAEIDRLKGTPTDNGFRTAPARYMKDDRELIDQHRDKYGDEAFRIHCLIAADEYEYRNGAKGDPEGDAEKAKWYRMMARHVEGNGPDPRADRPGFVPYQRIGGE